MNTGTLKPEQALENVVFPHIRLSPSLPRGWRYAARGEPVPGGSSAALSAGGAFPIVYFMSWGLVLLGVCLGVGRSTWGAVYAKGQEIALENYLKTVLCEVQGAELF